MHRLECEAIRTTTVAIGEPVDSSHPGTAFCWYFYSGIHRRFIAVYAICLEKTVSQLPHTETNATGALALVLIRW